MSRRLVYLVSDLFLSLPPSPSLLFVASGLLIDLGLHYPNLTAAIGSIPANGPSVDTLVGGADDQTEMGWQNLSLMFDPAYFLSMTHEDL